jgi:hypothetical protein
MDARLCCKSLPWHALAAMFTDAALTSRIFELLAGPPLFHVMRHGNFDEENWLFSSMEAVAGDAFKLEVVRKGTAFEKFFGGAYVAVSRMDGF